MIIRQDAGDGATHSVVILSHGEGGNDEIRTTFSGTPGRYISMDRGGKSR
ncbi:hypothetical protein ASZ90_016820 [hydrocarbon metagenome]|uniref:Uncharacterized protein n=1 Tax=hydrocarbon metagenome TaxID=938273 RepID=A0A0W8EAU7_9ZZZZ